MVKRNLGGKREYEAMWFATRKFGCWIPAPAYNPDISSVGWQADKALFINGGAFVHGSSVGHKEYQFSWNVAEPVALDILLAFSNNVYGKAPFYFIDAFAATRNILPSYWSAPGMAEDDGPHLAIGDVDFSDTPTSEYRHPLRTARYQVSQDSPYRLYVPIPEGMALWIGADGPNGSTGASPGTDTAELLVQPYLNSSAFGSPYSVEIMNVNTPTRYTHNFSSFTGVDIYLGGSGDISLSGINAQILPVGKTPSDINWIIGQGHSGCEFESKPSQNGYSAGLNLISYSAKLTEIGAWS